jgi:ComF family protein
VTIQTRTGFTESAPTGVAWLDRFRTAIIDLLFPPHCVACHHLGAWLCPDCLEAIETIHPPVCRRCGLPVSELQTTHSSTPICKRCQRAPLQLDGLLAYAFHDGPLREAIHQFKYADLRSLAGPLGQLMTERWATLTPRDLEPDVIVPVPLHPSRQRQRGYNQATLLARELASGLQRPVVKDVLVRIKATTPQVDLDARERRANVRDAFRCTDTSLSGKHVLLVDDVCTSGSTLESACVALRETGTLSVWAYTLARARPSHSQHKESEKWN